MHWKVTRCPAGVGEMKLAGRGQLEEAQSFLTWKRKQTWRSTEHPRRGDGAWEGRKEEGSCEPLLWDSETSGANYRNTLDKLKTRLE
eukprot:757021-Hanusia_phi.AAC.5